MNYKGVEFECKHVPSLQSDFIPLYPFFVAYAKGASKAISVALERDGGQIAVYDMKIYGTAEMAAADEYCVDRLVKTLLWMKGGYRVYISGDEAAYERVKLAYCEDGSRAFDADFFSKIYDKPFEVLYSETRKNAQESTESVGRHMSGCRIGFDAGGSDRKVSAVIDGEAVYSEEVVWHPKIKSDPEYHYEGIVSALKTAAEHLPRVDAVGISSAGIYINNETRSASLFLQVGAEDFEAKVRDIYPRAVRELGDVPMRVCNDGDVTALAGAMSLGINNILGIAMGTSEAGGYVNAEGNITGWLNELAFIPVDASSEAMVDEWSGDIGCGVKYFSQDAVIKLAPKAGIDLPEDLSPGEKLKIVQNLMDEGDSADEIFRSIGVYLGHSLALYHHFYGFTHIMLLGRVMSGRGGSLIVEMAEVVLSEEYPELNDKITIVLPDEKSRRVGQSVAAATLAEMK